MAERDQQQNQQQQQDPQKQANPEHMAINDEAQRNERQSPDNDPTRSVTGNERSKMQDTDGAQAGVGE
ncbi:MAG TPA: hypothetical protein VD996_12500 [Chitinophagaceae bacterium]|nr:hypothetical protein [Chitinophagaceae bacterium]